MASKDSDSDKNSVLMSDIDVDMNGENPPASDHDWYTGLDDPKDKTMTEALKRTYGVKYVEYAINQKRPVPFLASSHLDDFFKENDDNKVVTDKFGSYIDKYGGYVNGKKAVEVICICKELT